MFNNLEKNHNSEKKRLQVKEQILYNFAYILDNFPQYRITQHLVLLLRRRSTEGSEVFNWTDEELLNKFEKYVDELKSELTVRELEETH